MIGFFFVLTLILFIVFMIACASLFIYDNVSDRLLLTLGACLIGSMLACVSCSIYELWKESHAGQTVTNIGTGTIVRIETESFNPSKPERGSMTHTIIRLHGLDYRCYGYLPDAKRASVRHRDD